MLSLWEGASRVLTGQHGWFKFRGSVLRCYLSHRHGQGSLYSLCVTEIIRKFVMMFVIRK